ncbi:TonB family protein [Oleiharenicola lentus]|uniref:TonB family protein n=1 Tax=Oleiharenicola lentus TaxID=2508720 RepID=UPI003F662615
MKAHLFTYGLFLFLWNAIGLRGAVDVLPQPILQPAPEHPSALKQQRVVGSANLSFLIDINGEVKDIRVDYTNNDEFGRAATAAVAQWKYRPAMKGGEAVPLRVALPFSFMFSPAELAELDKMRVKEVLPPGPPVQGIDAVEKWPELKKQIRPKLPPSLQKKKQLGQAVIALVVDEQGVPRDIHPVMMTHPECGVEAMAAVSKWRFEPGMVADKAARVAMEVTLVFFPEAPSASGLRLRAGVQSKLPEIETTPPDENGALQIMPKPVKQTPPEYPAEMLNRYQGGQVRVDFIIDQRGEVTHVASTGDANLFFAIMAERAVSEWKFRPGLVEGKPVNIRANQLFQFGVP